MISQLRTNSVGAWWEAQVNQLFSLTKHHAKVSMLSSLKWMFWRHCEKWLVTLFYSFSAMLPLREIRLIKIWQRKKVILHLHWSLLHWSIWLSPELVGGGEEFEPCLAGVGNFNCVKSFQWNTGLLSFTMVVLKVKSSFERKGSQGLGLSLVNK